MPSITIKSGTSHKSYSCSEGGGGATASTSSILYLAGNLYCTYIAFSNIPTACGSTGPGSIKIKKATLTLTGVAPYSSSVNNTSTNAMRIGISNDASVAKKNTNIYSSASVYGPYKSNSYFSATTQKVTTTDVEVDFTEQIQAMFDNRNSAGGTVNYHTGNSYLWLCANSISSQSKSNCLRAGNGKQHTLTIEYYKTNIKVYDTSTNSWVTCGAKVYDSSTNSWIECGMKVYDSSKGWVEI